MDSRLGELEETKEKLRLASLLSRMSREFKISSKIITNSHLFSSTQVGNFGLPTNKALMLSFYLLMGRCYVRSTQEQESESCFKTLTEKSFGQEVLENYTKWSIKLELGKSSLPRRY